MYPAIEKVDIVTGVDNLYEFRRLQFCNMEVSQDMDETT
jgi:hypothetical protein